MIVCDLVVCALAQLAQTDPVTLACTGRALAYTADMSRAHVPDADRFKLRGAGDAVFFVRDRVIAGRKAFEWISISRVSGRYAHFIAFRDAASGSLESSKLMTAAGCEIAT